MRSQLCRDQRRVIALSTPPYSLPLRQRTEFFPHRDEIKQHFKTSSKDSATYWELKIIDPDMKIASITRMFLRDPVTMLSSKADLAIPTYPSQLSIKLSSKSFLSFKRSTQSTLSHKKSDMCCYLNNQETHLFHKYTYSYQPLLLQSPLINVNIQNLLSDYSSRPQSAIHCATMTAPSAASKLRVRFKNQNLLIKISGFQYESESQCLIQQLLLRRKLNYSVQGQTTQHLMTRTDNSEMSPILLKHLRKTIVHLAVRNPQCQ